VLQLEDDVRRLNERIVQLEYELTRTAPNPFLYQEDPAAVMLLSPDQMGFFD
jgi:hypothetical protein